MPTLEQELERIDAAIKNPPRTTIEHILEEQKDPTPRTKLRHLLGGAELNLTNVQLLWRLISAGSTAPGAYQEKFYTAADLRGMVCGSTVLPYLQQEMPASELEAFVAKYPIAKYSTQYFKKYASIFDEMEDEGRT
jgi:hypothetical protein